LAGPFIGRAGGCPAGWAADGLADERIGLFAIEPIRSPVIHLSVIGFVILPNTGIGSAVVG